MEKAYQPSKAQGKVYEYIKNKQDVEQSEIVKHFFIEFGYKDMNNARSGISRILTALKSSSLIYVRQEQNDGAGGIYKNVWNAV